MVKILIRGYIFSRVRPFYERAVSDLDKSMHRYLWAWVTHGSFIEGLHMTKNTATRIFIVFIVYFVAQILFIF